MSNTVYGVKSLKKTTMFKWIKRFNESYEGCKKNVRSGRLFTSCDGKIIEL